MLSQLRDAGFGAEGYDDQLIISTGEQHTLFIDPERVLTVAETYFKVFARKLRVNIEVSSKFSPFIAEFLWRMNKRGLQDRAIVRTRRVRPIGRGETLAPSQAASEDSKCGERVPEDRPCHSIDQVVFDADGTIRPCCGLNYEHDGIVVGAVSASSLKDTVMRI